jgi:hypothetical protein
MAHPSGRARAGAARSAVSGADPCRHPRQVWSEAIAASSRSAFADLDGARPVAGLPAVERFDARVVDRDVVGLDRHHGVRT